jgi:hypothetical protein
MCCLTSTFYLLPNGIPIISCEAFVMLENKAISLVKNHAMTVGSACSQFINVMAKPNTFTSNPSVYMFEA